VINDGPRTAFRYSTGGWSARRHAAEAPLFEALSPEAFAKLFCTKRALRGVTFELEIDDEIFVSCPTTATARRRAADDDLFYWGDDDDDHTQDDHHHQDKDDDHHQDDGDRRTVAAAADADDPVDGEEEQPGAIEFSVVWAAGRDSLEGLGGAEALRTTAADLAAALAHEERRVGYVSREAKVLLSAENRDAATATSRLARELRDACDVALSRRVERPRVVRVNDWIEVPLDDLVDPPAPANWDDDVDHQGEEEEDLREEEENDEEEEESLRKESSSSSSKRQFVGRRASHGDVDDDDVFFDNVSLVEDLEAFDDPNDATRTKRKPLLCSPPRAAYRPYETLLLREADDFDDDDDDDDAAAHEKVLLPAGATPQLAALVAAADPRKSFRELAEELCLSLGRVYDLADHLVRWKRATVAGAVRPDSVYAVAPEAFAPGRRRPNDDLADALAAFGAASTLRDAVAKLGDEDDARDDAVLRAIRAGFLTELHTYAIRIEGLPSADLENAAADAVRRQDSFPGTTAVAAGQGSGRSSVGSNHPYTAVPPLPRYPPRRAPATGHSSYAQPGHSSYAYATGHSSYATGYATGHSSYAQPGHSYSPSTETDSDFVVGLDLAPSATSPPAPLYGGGVLGTTTTTTTQPHHRHHRFPGVLDQQSSGSGLSSAAVTPRHLGHATEIKRLIDVFRKLSPYFDGRHSLVEMAWRESIDVPEIEAVLRAFKTLVVTVQR